MTTPHPRASLLPALLVALLASPTPSAAAAARAASARQEATGVASESDLCEVVKVVDGDTIHVRLDGAVEKLRLLSVDTEERLQTSYQGTATKPQTVFGEECALWAQDFFERLGHDGGPARVRLLFPGGEPRRDVYGRLLCHVLLEDGTDFNLLLVQRGKSPYFNKYGNSDVCHEAFQAAQREAREQQLGIWSPATNVAADGAPSALRPYDRLIPWWDARAQAVEAFRERSREDPTGCVAADDPAALEAALGADGLLVFAEIDRFFDERNGDWTVLLRTGDRDRAVRVHVPSAERARWAEIDLPARTREFAQNYLWLEGRLTKGERGFDLVVTGPEAVRPAGPELD